MACSILFAAATGFILDTNVTGWYTSNVSASLLGPFDEGELVWSLRPVEQGMWLLEDMFIGGVIDGSHQQFWIGEETLTYCGLLRHYLEEKTPEDPAIVLETFFKVAELTTPTVTTWCASPIAGGCSLFKWTMTVLNPTQIHMNVQLSPPVVHADFTMTFQNANPDGGYPSIPESDRKQCQLIASSGAYPWNNEYIPAKNIATKDLKRSKKTATTVAPINQTKFCFNINNSTGMKIQWSLTGDEVDVSVSAKTSGYIALGFYPAWPGMIKGQIILGGPKCGVSQFVSETYVGSPTATNWTTLTTPQVDVQNGVTSVSWRFTPPPPPAGFHSNGEVMWALGEETPSACDYPNYHAAVRGVFVLPSFKGPIPFSPSSIC